MRAPPTSKSCGRTPNSCASPTRANARAARTTWRRFEARMNKYTPFASKIVPLPNENVDTDQIIPARFLKVTDKAGLGDNLFADWRYHPDGSPKQDFILKRPEHQGAAI